MDSSRSSFYIFAFLDMNFLWQNVFSKNGRDNISHPTCSFKTLPHPIRRRFCPLSAWARLSACLTKVWQKWCELTPKACHKKQYWLPLAVCVRTHTSRAVSHTVRSLATLKPPCQGDHKDRLEPHLLECSHPQCQTGEEAFMLTPVRVGQRETWMKKPLTIG